MKKSRGSNSSANREKSRGLPTVVLKCIHLFAAVHFAYGLFYDFSYVHFPKTTQMSNNFGGKFKYLTVLDAVRFFFQYSCSSYFHTLISPITATESLC